MIHMLHLGRTNLSKQVCAQSDVLQYMCLDVFPFKITILFFWPFSVGLLLCSRLSREVL